MVTAAPAQRLPLTALLLAGALVAGFFLFWRTASPLSAWAGVDLDILFPPLAWWTVFALLSRLAAWAGGTRLAALRWRFTRSSDGLRAAAVLAFTRKLLWDLAWFGSALALIAALPALAEALSVREGGPVPDAALPYVAAFGLMPAWGLPVMALVAVARAAAEVRPGLGAVLPSPWPRLVALGIGYVLLSSDGVLAAAFAFEGSPLLVSLAAALALSWFAMALRNARATPLPPRLAYATAALLLLAEAAWILIVLGAVVDLSFAIESVLVDHFGLAAATAVDYARSIEVLTSPRALAVLLPFALIRAVGVFRPEVDRILGFPAGRLALLGLVYVLLSGGGVLDIAIGSPLPQVVTVLTLALALSYAAAIVGNVARVDLPFRYWPAAAVALGLASSALAALAAGMSVWVVLDHLPVVNAALIDNETTRSVGREVLPQFSAFFDVRLPATALASAMAFALTLPRSPGDRAFAPYQPLLNAVAWSAAGFLVWVVGSTLSPAGHGFVLGGAAGAAGMFALGLSQVFGYAAGSQNALAPAARWLAVSPLRGVVLGAAVAVYGLLLRPVLYEMLWFAALYEYIALLLVLVLALMFVVDLLRRDAAVPEAQAPESSGWTRHRQVLESKDDPRAALAAGLRLRFVDYGEWKPLWSYLMGLLYRNGASLEEMCAVLRPLRAVAVSSAALRFLDRTALRRLGRAAALDDALRHTDEVLSSAQPRRPTVGEDDLRMAAARFVETGADVERLVVALIVAHCRQGLDVQSGIDRWFFLLDAPDPASGAGRLPWARAGAGLRDRHARVRIVDAAAATLFGAPPGGSANRSAGTPPDLAGVSGASGP